MSTLKNYNNTRGAFEFSLIKQGVVGQVQWEQTGIYLPFFQNLLIRMLGDIAANTDFCGNIFM